MIDAIMKGKPKYDTPIWESVDESAKDFVQKLIVVDPNERMDSTAALKHPWLTDRTILPSDKPSIDLLHKIDSSLLNYKYTSQLKKIALNVIALRSTSNEIIELQKVFETLDIEKNGILTISQFKKGLEMLDHSNDFMQDLFASIVSVVCKGYIYNIIQTSVMFWLL
jgi:calcium-dependent protein kinase